MRKIVYGVIYVGVAIAFPALPLSGLKFIGGMFSGAYQGFAKDGMDLVKDQGKDKAVDILTEVKGPIWKILNPFE